MHKTIYTIFFIIYNNVFDNIKKVHHQISNIYILKYLICPNNLTTFINIHIIEPFQPGLIPGTGSRGTERGLSLIYLVI